MLATLRENLFNPLTSSDEISDDPESLVREIRYLECGDRDTEIRTIAREVKRLVLTENYDLAEIALVVRQRATYGPTITRVMLEESLPCNLELRIEAGDVPANRAALKLLSLLEGLSSEETQATRIAEVADLIKSEYFRLSDAEMQVLSSRFDEQHLDLLRADVQTLTPETLARLKNRYRIGFWDADSLENAFAYVGSDLSVSAWLARAFKLYTDLPGAIATKELLNIDRGCTRSRHGHRRQRRERRNGKARRERSREEATSFARYSSCCFGVDCARGPTFFRTAARSATRR